MTKETQTTKKKNPMNGTWYGIWCPHYRGWQGMWKSRKAARDANRWRGDKIVAVRVTAMKEKKK